MELVAAGEYQLSPQEQVFRLEELLALILEYVTPSGEKQDLLRFRTIGRVWGKCASKMFKEPPFKVCLDMEGMLECKNIFQFVPDIPMEITVKGWLSRRKLRFLRGFSDNVQTLNLEGVEGVQEYPNNPPHLPKLRKLTVDNQFEVYYKPGKMFDFINNLATFAPKLEVFKVIWNGKVSRHFQKSPVGCALPESTTELKSVNVSAFSLNKILLQSNLTNLSAVELDLKYSSVRYRNITRILDQQFGNIQLKKLKLHFQAPRDNFIWIHPMRHLEEFETNVSIYTFDRMAPLSLCLPKIKSLKCTGDLITTLSTFVMEGSNYKHLQSLTLHGSSFLRYGENNQNRAEAYERSLISKIKLLGFPTLPSLKSLSWRGFSHRLTGPVLPRFFANSKQLSELDIGLQDIMIICGQFLYIEENMLAGTNFNRLTKLSIHFEPPDFCSGFCSDFLYTISLALPYLETIKLGENVKIDSYTKNLWQMSGRKMIVDPANVEEQRGTGKNRIWHADQRKLYFGLGDVKNSKT